LPAVSGEKFGLADDADPSDPIVAILREFDEPDPTWWERAAAIQVPTLIIAGGQDSHVPQDQVVALAQRIPDCRLLTIPVGHRVHSTVPDDFTAAVAGFLGS
jgi:3-oxoadipate enol-lactonase